MECVSPAVSVRHKPSTPRCSCSDLRGHSPERRSAAFSYSSSTPACSKKVIPQTCYTSLCAPFQYSLAEVSFLFVFARQSLAVHARGTCGLFFFWVIVHISGQEAAVCARRTPRIVTFFVTERSSCVFGRYEEEEKQSVHQKQRSGV